MKDIWKFLRSKERTQIMFKFAAKNLKARKKKQFDWTKSN